MNNLIYFLLGFWVLEISIIKTELYEFIIFTCSFIRPFPNNWAGNLTVITILVSHEQILKERVPYLSRRKQKKPQKAHKYKLSEDISIIQTLQRLTLFV